MLLIGPSKINELMTALTCHKMVHLTALSGRQGARRVAGRTTSFGMLLAIIADGSTCCLMSDGGETSDIDYYQWAGNICPIDFSIGQIESVLS